ncbi:peptidylprolyl isomerase [Pontimicrobium aquaticum]|uniref:peptidylprolyl isomerase n=2 Tax=Pontimicrobium aquaticum TaxID=2565367 RepID=A0A4U0EX63_9FLAO|nr:peptidylprolyl isomerase [Pontimicrobium aquaticum]
MKIILLALFTTVLSCDEKYPDLGDGLFAEIVTNKGTMVAKLHYKKTPVTVANFVALAEGNHPMVDSVYKGKKFYNGLIFHRVMNDFMIQGGDPLGTGRGNPGYRFGDEFDDTLKHDKPGILSMANSGPGTNGSQFFITEKPTPWLDNIHTVFGELALGLEIQDTISNVQVEAGNKPAEDVVIEEINIVRQGFEARKYDAVKTWETELPLLEEKAKEKKIAALKKAEEERKKAEEMAQNAANEFLPTINDYKAKTKALPSGLMMYTIKEGNGEKPKQGQKAKVWYEGYFTDGKLLDTNRKEIAEKHGQYNQMREQQQGYAPMPTQIGPDAQMIAGFNEGLANMKVGDKVFLYIPSHLAWGENGRPPVKPNTDVVFIVEMVEIVK